MSEGSQTPSFRTRVRNGETLIGIWSSLCNNLVAEILGLTGYDWVLLDAEHSPNDPANIVTQLQGLNGSPSEPMVRPPWNDAVMIKRIMDIGAKSLIVPFVQTKEEALAAVSATRYPPQGLRGIAASTRASRYGTDTDYWQRINDEVTLMLQVESQTTLDNLEEICSVDEVDCLFVGPNDLAASLGYLRQPDVAAVQDRIKWIAETCRANGKTPGILASAPDEAKQYLDYGYTVVGVGADIGILRSGATALRAQF